MGYLPLSGVEPQLHSLYQRGGQMVWIDSQALIVVTVSRVDQRLLARYNREVVQWQSKMQKTVLLSTVEAEYYSASEMAVEVLYLRNLLENLLFMPAPDKPVCLKP
jgi:hypothetical protein